MAEYIGEDELEKRLNLMKRLIDDNLYEIGMTSTISLIRDNEIKIQQSDLDDFFVDLFHFDDMVKKQLTAFLNLGDETYSSIDTHDVFTHHESNMDTYAAALIDNAEFFSEYICKEIRKIAMPIDNASGIFPDEYSSILPLLDEFLGAEIEEDWYLWLMCARALILMKGGAFIGDALLVIQPLVENLDSYSYTAFSLIDESMDGSLDWEENKQKWLFNAFVNGSEFFNFTKWLLASDWENDDNIEYTFSDMYGEFDYHEFHRFWLADEIFEHQGFLSSVKFSDRLQSAFAIFYHARELGYDFIDFKNSECGKYLLRNGFLEFVNQMESF